MGSVLRPSGETRPVCTRLRSLVVMSSSIIPSATPSLSSSSLSFLDRIVDTALELARFADHFAIQRGLFFWIIVSEGCVSNSCHEVCLPQLAINVNNVVNTFSDYCPCRQTHCHCWVFAPNSETLRPRTRSGQTASRYDCVRSRLKQRVLQKSAILQLFV